MEWGIVDMWFAAPGYWLGVVLILGMLCSWSLNYHLGNTFHMAFSVYGKALGAGHLWPGTKSREQGGGPI